MSMIVEKTFKKKTTLFTCMFLWAPTLDDVSSYLSIPSSKILSETGKI